jgi:hypothetical protein
VAVGNERGKNDPLNAAAKNVRIELARAFPGVKFSVKTSRFSGGDSLRVSWTDGPTSGQVDEIVGKYSAGSFDGMQDLYTYERNAWTDAFGDAKYVSVTRNYSAAAVESVLRTLRAKYPANMAALEKDAALTADDYLLGRRRGEPLFCATNYRHDWALEVSVELARRTWALNKTPAAPAVDVADEVPQ